MKSRSANCPACGGPVIFRVSSSLVTVCEFCHTVVGRGDKQVDDHGKVGDVVQTQSRLVLGMSGKYDKRRFDVVGRVQYQHAAGGIWDEWYLAFPGDRWGWLAVAQGRYFLTFERRIKGDAALPAFDEMQIGQSFVWQDHELAVSEKGTATIVSAEGEIPWPVRPGANHRYADLKGHEGAFGTLDFNSESPRLFVGQAILIDELHLSGDNWQASDATIAIGAVQVSCPHCGGTLTLHAPDQSQRVTCQNCAALLDASHGKLQYLETLAARQAHPVVPLGTQGTLNGVAYTVIGFMERYAQVEGTTYPWTEYLLYNSDVGFRWLVENGGHWSFVEPVDLIVPWPPPDKLQYAGSNFRVYDRGTAYVRCVLGEFPWQVRVGEVVTTADLIAPPHMLSFEHSYASASPGELPTDHAPNDMSAVSVEVNVSLGTYMAVDEVERAFGVSSVARPWGVGTIQPGPEMGSEIWGLYVLFLALLAAIQWLYHAPVTGKGADIKLMFLAILAVSIIPIATLIFKHGYEVKRWSNSDFSPYSQES